MPTIHRYKGYRFFFFSNERNEPAHVHAEMGDSVAKFWLDERIALASAYGFSGHELTEIAGIIHDNRASMLRKWNEFFSQDRS